MLLKCCLNIKDWIKLLSCFLLIGFQTILIDFPYFKDWYWKRQFVPIMKIWNQKKQLGTNLKVSKKIRSKKVYKKYFTFSLHILAILSWYDYQIIDFLTINIFFIIKNGNKNCSEWITFGQKWSDCLTEYRIF